MPVSAFETSRATASTSAPMTTSRAPRNEAEDQTATPATISSTAGRMPSRKTAPPIAMLPVICWPQRLRKIEADRFSVSSGPLPSIAITGTARKVTSDQAMPTRRGGDLAADAALVLEHAHHGADRGVDRGPAADLGEAAAGDGEAVGDRRLLAAEDHVRAGRQGDAEVEADDAERVDADHDQRDRPGQLVLVEQVETRAEEDDRRQQRRHRAIEREADQRAVLVQQPPAFLRQAPAAFDPAHRFSPSVLRT